jgi:hypothetical protein
MKNVVFLSKWAVVSYLVVLLLMGGSGCKAQSNQAAQAGDHPYTNALIDSKSPYLLQHAHNPVNWHPWGEAALEEAAKEDKLLLISVGYAACHWCHVMEHESFEDTAVARLMNEHFVPIKVDREERPDVDQIYMNAAYMTTGRGGWPLNAIALPDGRPIFAATYFPKAEWTRMLEQFIKLKQENPEKLTEAADQITLGLKRMDFVELNPEPPLFQASQLERGIQSISGQMDFRQGGLNKAPKFPMPSIHEWLLHHHALSGNGESLEAAELTLDQMLAGGIYDQVGGGFARYSTDAKWLVPHFEKMLYDNAQLVSLYAHAYQLTDKPSYRRAIEETLTFVERELTSPEGGFYSSLDADSDGEEGKFYVWSKAEIDSLLGEEAAIFAEVFDVTAGGNWEEKNILHLPQPLAEVADRHGMSEADLQAQLDRNKATLLTARAERIRPGLDDKQLTAWNALMLKGYVDAYRALGEEKYLTIARRNAAFLQQNMQRKDGGLNRTFKDGSSDINAFADDYALLIQAYISLYQATFEEEWLTQADELMQYALAHFYEEASGLFFYTSDEDAALITRSREIPDNVIPGSNSVLATDLYFLGTYLYQTAYLEKAQKMTQTVLPQLEENGAYYAQWGQLLTHLVHQPYEVAIVGEQAQAFRAELDADYLPQVLFLGGKEEGKLELLQNKAVKGATFIYVCQDKVCQLPVEEVSKARELLK